MNVGQMGFISAYDSNTSSATIPILSPSGTEQYIILNISYFFQNPFTTGSTTIQLAITNSSTNYNITNVNPNIPYSTTYSDNLSTKIFIDANSVLNLIVDNGNGGGYITILRIQ